MQVNILYIYINVYAQSINILHVYVYLEHMNGEAYFYIKKYTFSTFYYNIYLKKYFVFHTPNT